MSTVPEEETIPVVKYYYSPLTKKLYDFKIDDGAKEITAKRFSDLLNLISEGYVLSEDSTGMPLASKPVEEPTPELTPTEIYNHRMYQLNNDYEMTCRVIRGEYPKSETDTWPVQLPEAIAYMSWIHTGKQGPSPTLYFLDVLSDERTSVSVGDGLEDLARRVLANAQVYNQYMAKATAIRHAAEKQLKVALSTDRLDLINSVTWDFTSTFN